MARSAVSLLITCALAAALVMAISTVTESFVGGAAQQGHRVAQRAPEVAMRFFNFEPATTTTTPPPPELLADANYVVGITAFFFLSVAANAKGFFGPW
uniref:Uncharacterized protein n=1 Tax=Alexandrium fundyense TaxID=2932 RepID=A4UHF1_ALEFU|nr:unknown [Alexandrium fundyense]